MKNQPLPTYRQQGMDPKAKTLLLGLLFAVLALPHVSAFAQSTTTLSFPVIDQVLCAFISYSKTRLAPMIAVIVIILSVVGHWVGSGKMWNIMLYVGLGLGIIMGIGTLIANFSGVSGTCLSA